MVQVNPRARLRHGAKIMNFALKKKNCFIENEELCIKNDEFCRMGKRTLTVPGASELCIKHDELCITDEH